MLPLPGSQDVTGDSALLVRTDPKPTPTCPDGPVLATAMGPNVAVPRCRHCSVGIAMAWGRERDASPDTAMLASGRLPVNPLTFSRILGLNKYLAK